MPDAFKIRKGAPAVEIAGVGLVDENTDVPLSRAADRMPELQDENGKPLTGAALQKAARAWAERVGHDLQVGKSSSNEEEESFTPVSPAGGSDAPASAPDNEE